MKKIYLCFAAAAALLSVSCQKENVGYESSSEKMITKTMVVEDDIDTKTSYEPGIGVKWDGTESMAIWYGNPANAADPSKAAIYMNRVDRNNISASTGGPGTYQFTHTEISGVTKYDYAVITPDLSTTSQNSAGAAASVKFSPVQNPGQNTFDPNYDIMFAKGAKEVDISTSLKIEKFKRMFAPFVVKIRDSKGLIANDGGQIFAVNTYFSKEATNQTNALAGLFYLNFGADDYNECKLNSVTGSSNAVTAIYSEGLEKTGDDHPVWYMVNANSFPINTQMTVTVTTATKTIKRTVTLTEQVTIDPKKINSISIDISGDGYTEETTIFQDFATWSDNTTPVAASNGTNYSWGVGSNNVKKGADSAPKSLPFYLRIESGGALTLPEINGKPIKKIRIYAHPRNTNNKTNNIQLNNGEAVDFRSFAKLTDDKDPVNHNALAVNGGFVEIEVPTETTSPLVLNATGADGIVTGIAAIAFVL